MASRGLGWGVHGGSHTVWRWGLSITFRAGTDGPLEVAEKLDVQATESTNNTFAIALSKMGLVQNSRTSQ